MAVLSPKYVDFICSTPDLDLVSDGSIADDKVPGNSVLPDVEELAKELYLPD
ncbi:hypothetical protein QMP26_41455 (plasmid) [Enterocloster clostridioformis]